MKAIDLCDILKRNYKKGEFQCNMDNCGNKPCDLCTVEKFEKEIRADAIRKFAEWCKLKGYGCYDWRMLIEEYEKEQK